MIKILIVDDSEELLLLFTHFLSMKGYTVASAKNKETLFNKIANFSPDLILLDVKLNGADGRLLCKEVKSALATQHIPIVLVSANPELLKNYKDCHAADVIQKPFDINSVAQKIQRTLAMASFS